MQRGTELQHQQNQYDLPGALQKGKDCTMRGSVQRMEGARVPSDGVPGSAAERKKARGPKEEKGTWRRSFSWINYRADWPAAGAVAAAEQFNAVVLPADKVTVPVPPHVRQQTLSKALDKATLTQLMVPATARGGLAACTAQHGHGSTR